MKIYNTEVMSDTIVIVEVIFEKEDHNMGLGYKTDGEILTLLFDYNGEFIEANFEFGDNMELISKETLIKYHPKLLQKASAEARIYGDERRTIVRENLTRKYRLVKENDSERLEKEVNRLMRWGYEPLGNLVEKDGLIQPMILRSFLRS